jgi:hypothetical protein
MNWFDFIQYQTRHIFPDAEFTQGMDRAFQRYVYGKYRECSNQASGEILKEWGSVFANVPSPKVNSETVILRLLSQHFVVLILPARLHLKHCNPDNVDGLKKVCEIAAPLLDNRLDHCVHSWH